MGSTASPIPASKSIPVSKLPNYPLSSYYGNLVTSAPPSKKLPSPAFSNNITTKPVTVQSPSPAKASPSPSSRSPSSRSPSVPKKQTTPGVDFVPSQDKLGPFENPYGKYTIYQ
jgi:hypothetical protein